ncbi:MAG: YHS domain-containing protein [Actinomycetota bacterium]
MDLTVAIILSVAFAAISVAVGIRVMRFKDSITEMMGMMVGMTMGMMAGIAIGTYVGTATDMFVSNVVGVLAGIAFGAAFGRAGGLMGVLDGSMGGFMGGMMGAMLGVMVNIGTFQVWATAALITVVCLVIYVGLIRLVRSGSVARYATDPVCFMAVNVATSKLSTSYHGEVVHFCAPSCLRAFEDDPERYLVRLLRRRDAPTGSKATIPA